jgi:hypothetical protein
MLQGHYKQMATTCYSRCEITNKCQYQHLRVQKKNKITRFMTHRMKYLVRALEEFGGELVVFGDELCAWR